MWSALWNQVRIMLQVFNRTCDDRPIIYSSIHGSQKQFSCRSQMKHQMLMKELVPFYQSITHYTCFLIKMITRQVGHRSVLATLGPTAASSTLDSPFKINVTCCLKAKNRTCPIQSVFIRLSISLLQWSTVPTDRYALIVASVASAFCCELQSIVDGDSQRVETKDARRTWSNSMECSACCTLGFFEKLLRTHSSMSSHQQLL